MYKYIYYIIMSTFSTFQISQSRGRFCLFVCLFVCVCLRFWGFYRDFGDELRTQIGAAGLPIHFVQHKTSTLIQGGGLFADL